MQFLTIKNWSQYQHYKKRSPAWIKLHRVIVEDYSFAALKDKTKAHLMLIWVMAAGTDGRVPCDPVFIGKRINATESIDLDAMITAGFLIPEGDAPQPTAEPAGNTDKNSEYRKLAEEVIAFLNDKAGRNFDLNGANAGHVVARLREGETVEDMRSIIAKKCREWKGDPNMNKYLRPETLFNRTKYASYKGELGASE